MSVADGLLVLLAEEPKHGYQLATDFAEHTAGRWVLNTGQVYTTLDRLARDGFVRSDEVDGQKRYAITAAGREELGRWWKRVPGDAPPPRDELLVKILLAVDEGPDHALEVITRHRTALTQLLQLHRRSSTDGDDLAASLVAEALVARAEADLRWLDTCEARVLRARATSTVNGDIDG